MQGWVHLCFRPPGVAERKIVSRNDFYSRGELIQLETMTII